MVDNQLLVDIRQPSYLFDDLSEPLRINSLTETFNKNELFVFLCTTYLHDMSHRHRFQWPSQIKYRDLFETCLYRTRASEVRKKRLPDYNVRLKLGKLVGLGNIPKPDSNAIQKLSGMIEDKILNEAIDSVELIREIRGS